jgi:hypothetical protein
MTRTKHGLNFQSERIARSFFSTFNVTLLAEMLCGYFTVKRKLFRVSSVLKQLSSRPLFLFHTRDSHSTGVCPAENVPFCVQNDSQSAGVTVTSTVKFFDLETIATAAPQNFERFSLEDCEDLRINGGLFEFLIEKRDWEENEFIPFKGMKKQ